LVGTAARPAIPPKPAKEIAVETRFVGTASTPTTPPNAPAPPAIEITLTRIVDVVAESRDVVEILDSVVVVTIGSNPTTPPKAPAPLTTVELAASVVVVIESEEEVVSVVVILESVVKMAAPTTPPNASAPPAMVTTEPAVGAELLNRAPTAPPKLEMAWIVGGRVFVSPVMVAVVLAKAISVLVTVTVRRDRVVESVEVDTESAGVVRASVRIPVGRAKELVFAVNVESVEVVESVAVVTPTRPAPFPTTVFKSRDATDVSLRLWEVKEDSTAALFLPKPCRWCRPTNLSTPGITTPCTCPPITTKTVPKKIIFISQRCLCEQNPIPRRERKKYVKRKGGQTSEPFCT
jgi:hypothetical protein